MKFGSVCSGIEAASVAWEPLGWKAAWFAEIEPFPSAVLAHHYPGTPNLGDMTAIARRVLVGEVEAPDMLCGGTPCQAFSVAGLRESLSDDRGNLTLKFVELADAIDHVRVRAGKPAAVVFWENVPGVLSTKDNAFGCFLAGLAGEDDPLQPPGGKWSNAGAVYGPQRAVAWRTLDAQYFGVAQRRRRVFVVASARNDFDPAAVLFEWDSLRRDSAPSRQAGQSIAPAVTAGAPNGGAAHGARSGSAKEGLIVPHVPELAACLTRGTGLRYDTDTDTILPVHVPEVAGTMKACKDSGGWSNSADHAAAGYMVPVAFDTTQITSAANYSNPQPGDACHPLAAGAHAPAIAFPANLSGTQHASTENLAPAMGAKNPTAVALAVALRGREGGATAELGDEVQNCLRASGGGGDKAHVLAPVFLHANKGRPDGRQSAHTEMVSVKPLVETLTTDGHAQSAVAYTTKLHNTQSNNAGKIFEERTTALDANSPPPALLTAMQVRRLTPVECERLQGFSDNYTAIPWRKKPASECPDGPRYKALGNSWAVPNVRWLGRRIEAALKRGAA